MYRWTATPYWTLLVSIENLEIYLSKPWITQVLKQCGQGSMFVVFEFVFWIRKFSIRVHHFCFHIIVRVISPKLVSRPMKMQFSLPATIRSYSIFKFRWRGKIIQDMLFHMISNQHMHTLPAAGLIKHLNINSSGLSKKLVGERWW